LNSFRINRRPLRQRAPEEIEPEEIRTLRRT